jgi:hypothetical protein
MLVETFFIALAATSGGGFVANYYLVVDRKE